MSVNGRAASAFLGPPKTAGYVPRVYGQYLSFNSQRPLFQQAYIEAMLDDDQVWFGLDAVYGPLHAATWEVRADSPRVRQFVDEQLRRIWERAGAQLFTFVEYGFKPAEVVYALEGRRYVFDSLIELHPLDAVPLQIDNRLEGIEVKNAGCGTGAVRLGPPRSLWLVYKPRFSPFFGRSRLRSAWRPWMEKTGRQMALDLRLLHFAKNSSRGDVLYYPPGNVDTSTDLTPNYRSNQDLAREIVEKIPSGGVLTMPSVVDPATGKRVWELTPPQSISAPGQLLEWIKDLNLEILRGLGVPPEVLQASGESGSGYAGRSVPLKVFHAGEDSIVRQLLHQISTQVLRWLVRANFGRGHRFEVVAKPLAPEPPPGGAMVPGGGPFDAPGGGEGGDGGEPTLDSLLGGGGGGEDVWQPHTGPKGGRGQKNERTGRVKYGQFSMADPTLERKVRRQAAAAFPRRPVTLSAGPHKYSSTQVNLPGHVARAAIEAAASIPDGELAEDGREDEPHVTVKYGLHTDAPGDVANVVGGFGPVAVGFGPVSVFEAKEGADYDVVKVEVVSPDLHRLNAKICEALDHTDTHPDYHPHVTLAYVKPGEGRKYEGWRPLAGAKCVFDAVTFSDREGNRSVVSLAGGTPQPVSRPPRPVRLALGDGSPAGPVMQAILLAMLDAAADGLEGGTPETAGMAREEIDRLAALAKGDGLQELLDSLGAVRLSSGDWAAAGTSRSGVPRWVRQRDNRKQYRYQKTRPGEHTEKRLDDRAKGEAAIKVALEVAYHKDVTPERLATMAEHVGGMTLSQLSRIRGVLSASFGGARRREELVGAIRQHVRGLLEGAGGKAKPEAAAAPKADVPPTSSPTRQNVSGNSSPKKPRAAPGAKAGREMAALRAEMAGQAGPREARPAAPKPAAKSPAAAGEVPRPAPEVPAVATSPAPDRQHLAALRARAERQRAEAQAELDRAFPHGRPSQYPQGYDDRLRLVRDAEADLAAIDAKLGQPPAASKTAREALGAARPAGGRVVKDVAARPRRGQTAAPPSAPPPAGDPLAPDNLAAIVRDVGRAVPDAIRGTPMAEGQAAWDVHKPLVADLYHAAKARLGGATLEQFKAALLRAFRAGEIELSRNDMPQRVKGDRGFERSQESEIGYLNGTFHAVNLNAPLLRKPPRG